MKTFVKKNIGFLGGVCALVLLILALAGFTLRLRINFTKVDNEFTKNILALKKIQSLDPSAIESNLRKAQQNNTTVQKAFDMALGSIKGSRKLKVLDESRKAFWISLSLRDYKESMTEEISKAQTNGSGEGFVATTIDFSNISDFGFSRYLSNNNAHQMPENQELLKKIYLQKQILAYLVKQAAMTTPQRIDALKRQTLEGEDRGRFTDEIASPNEPSATIADIIEIMTFQIGFTGYTTNLREFLLEIEKFELPLVVRNIKIEGAQDKLPTSSSRNTNGREPIVKDNLSSFLLTIDCVTPKAKTKEATKK